MSEPQLQENPIVALLVAPLVAFNEAVKRSNNVMSTGGADVDGKRRFTSEGYLVQEVSTKWLNDKNIFG